MATPSPPASPTMSKRKRDDQLAELEIDVEAPEPPSKKALRRAKKGKSEVSKPDVAASSPSGVSGNANNGTDPKAPHTTDDDAEQPGAEGTDQAAPPKTAKKPKKERSVYGVWIGNLPFTMDKNALRTYLHTHGGIDDADITRVHLPAPAGNVPRKPLNKGFAYVDFSSMASQSAAIGLSENLVGGRRLLIKDAQSFEGRPKPDKAAAAADKKPGHPPNKRVFVGNLGFDIDRTMLREHLAPCGPVDDVFLATFEDSGKCKGYGWVTFADLQGATSAVRGYAEVEDEGADPAREGEGEGKAKRSRRIWVRGMHGRQLRMEFAEDASVRYQKRYGKSRAPEEQPPAEE